MPSDRGAAAKGDAAEPLYSLTEVAFHLQVAPESLRGWKRRFGVLLSPACASLDMFRNYVHRAEVFVAAARRLPEVEAR